MSEKLYRRAFIPRSHRPFVFGMNFQEKHAPLTLAAKILDASQRQSLLADWVKLVLEDHKDA